MRRNPFAGLVGRGRTKKRRAPQKNVCGRAVEEVVIDGCGGGGKSGARQSPQGESQHRLKRWASRVHEKSSKGCPCREPILGGGTAHETGRPSGELMSLLME